MKRIGLLSFYRSAYSKEIKEFKICCGVVSEMKFTYKGHKAADIIFISFSFHFIHLGRVALQHSCFSRGPSLQLLQYNLKKIGISC